MAAGLRLLPPWQWLPAVSGPKHGNIEDAGSSAADSDGKTTSTPPGATPSSKPVACLIFFAAFFAFVLSTIPFLVRVSGGVLSRTNLGKGVFMSFGPELWDTYRSTLGVEQQHPLSYNGAILEATYQLKEHRKRYEFDFRARTHKGSLRREGVDVGNEKCYPSLFSETGRSAENVVDKLRSDRVARKRKSVKLAFRSVRGSASGAADAHEDSSDHGFCTENGLLEMWRFDEWLRTVRLGKKNVQWRGDACPLERTHKFQYESCHEKHRNVCGLKELAGEMGSTGSPTPASVAVHPPCVSARSSNTCRCKLATPSAPNACVAGKTLRESILNPFSNRFLTAEMQQNATRIYDERAYCEVDDATPNTVAECTDLITVGTRTSSAAQDASSGVRLYSSVPCVDHTIDSSTDTAVPPSFATAASATVGEPVDQMGPGYWCGRYDMMTPTSFLKFAAIKIEATTDYLQDFRSFVNSTHFNQVRDRGFSATSPKGGGVQEAEIDHMYAVFVPDMMGRASREDVRPNCMKGNECLKAQHQCARPRSLILSQYPNATGEQPPLSSSSSTSSSCAAATTASTGTTTPPTCADTSAYLSELGSVRVPSCANITVEFCVTGSGTTCDKIASACRSECQSLLLTAQAASQCSSSNSCSSAGATTTDSAPQPFCSRFSNERPPGSQDAAVCTSLSTESACFQSGCQWVSLQMLGEAAGGVPTEQPKCLPCGDSGLNAYFQSFAALMPPPANACSQSADPCTCMASLPLPVAFCDGHYAAIDFCPILCPARQKSCANIARTGFVEVEVEQTLAGNQHGKTCEAHNTNESSCRKSGCSWMSDWDVANLVAGGFDVAAAPQRCFPCVNQEKPILQHFAGLASTPCATAEDVCACAAQIPNVCQNPSLVSWWMCPHVCPTHATSCANVGASGFEEISTARLIAGTSSSSSTSSATASAPVTFHYELAIPGSQSRVHCDASSVEVAAMSLTNSAPHTQVAMGTCLSRGCTYFAAAEAAVFAQLGYSNAALFVESGTTPAAAYHPARNLHNCLTCIDRGDLAEKFAAPLGITCVASACCSVLQQGGGCARSDVPRACPQTCSASALSCANTAGTGFAEASATASLRGLEVSRKPRSLLDGGRWSSGLGRGEVMVQTMNKDDLHDFIQQGDAPHLRRRSRLADIFRSSSPSPQQLRDLSSSCPSRSNASQEICDCCNRNMFNDAGDVDSIGRPVHRMAQKRTSTIQNCTFWLGWMNLRSPCELEDTFDYSRLVNVMNGSAAGTSSPRVPSTIDAADVDDYLTALTDLYLDEGPGSGNFTFNISGQHRAAVEVLLFSDELLARDIASALITKTVGDWGFAVELFLTYALFVSILRFVGFCDLGTSYVMPLVCILTAALAFGAGVCGVSCVEMFSFDESGRRSPLNVLDADGDGAGEKMLPLMFPSLLLWRALLWASLLWGGKMVAAVRDSTGVEEEDSEVVQKREKAPPIVESGAPVLDMSRDSLTLPYLGRAGAGGGSPSGNAAHRSSTQNASPYRVMRVEILLTALSVAVYCGSIGLDSSSQEAAPLALRFVALQLLFSFAFLALFGGLMLLPALAVILQSEGEGEGENGMSGEHQALPSISHLEQKGTRLTVEGGAGEAAGGSSSNDAYGQQRSDLLEATPQQHTKTKRQMHPIAGSTFLSVTGAMQGNQNQQQAGGQNPPVGKKKIRLIATDDDRNPCNGVPCCGHVCASVLQAMRRLQTSSGLDHVFGARNLEGRDSEMRGVDDEGNGNGNFAPSNSKVEADAIGMSRKASLPISYPGTIVTVLAVLIVRALPSIFLLPTFDKIEAEFLNLNEIEGKSRSFVRAVAENLGTEKTAVPAEIVLYLPPSSIGQYHVKENRDYYMNFIDEKLLLEDANEAGSPHDHDLDFSRRGLGVVRSWLFDFERSQRGRDRIPGDRVYSKPFDPMYDVTDWSLAMGAYPLPTCPLIFEKTTDYQEILVALPTASASAGGATTFSDRVLAALRSDPVLGQKLEGRAAAGGTSKLWALDVSVSAHQSTFGTAYAGPQGAKSGFLQQATAAGPQLTIGPTPSTFRSAFCRNCEQQNVHGQNHTVEYHVYDIVLKRKQPDPLRADEIVLLSQFLPKTETEDMNLFPGANSTTSAASVDALLNRIAALWEHYELATGSTGAGSAASTTTSAAASSATKAPEFDLSVRFTAKNSQKLRGGSMTAMMLRDSFLKQRRQQCRLEPNLYEERVDFWGRNPRRFYQYVHLLFEESTGGLCGDNFRKPDSLMEVAEPDKASGTIRDMELMAHEVYYDYDEIESVSAAVEPSMGLLHIPVHLFAKNADHVLNPQRRIEQARKLERLLEAEKKARPERWFGDVLNTAGKIPQTGFFHASFLQQAERDAGLKRSLFRSFFLGLLSLTVFLAVFLHPVFGPCLSGVVTLTTYEILGLLSVLDVKINLVTITAVIFLQTAMQLIWLTPIACGFVFNGTDTQLTGAASVEAEGPPSRGLVRANKALKNRCYDAASLLATTVALLLALACAMGAEAVRPFYSVLLLASVWTRLQACLFFPVVLGAVDEGLAAVGCLATCSSPVAGHGKAKVGPLDNGHAGGGVLGPVPRMP